MLAAIATGEWRKLQAMSESQCAARAVPTRSRMAIEARRMRQLAGAGADAAQARIEREVEQIDGRG